MQQNQSIESLTQIATHKLPHFEGQPFSSYLANETGDLYIHENWKYGLTGKVLNTQIGSKTFGDRFDLLNAQGDLSEIGKKVIQWGSWFVNGVFLHETHKWDGFMQNDIVNSLGLNPTEGGARFFTTLKNLALLQSLGQTFVTPEDWEIAENIDLNQISLKKAFNIVETQPGYWGKSRLAKKIEQNNVAYGVNNWQTLFTLSNQTLITPQQFSESFFQNAYKNYFNMYPEQLEFLAKNASQFFEEDGKEIEDIGMGFDLTSYPFNTKFQFAILRKLMLLNGLNFEGSDLVAIRGTNKEDSLAGPVYPNLGRLGRILHPGAVAMPFHLQTQIPEKSDTLTGWWEKWEQDQSVMNSNRFPPLIYGDNLASVEQCYHRAKCIVVKKHSDVSIAQALAI